MSDDLNRREVLTGTLAGVVAAGVPAIAAGSADALLDSIPAAATTSGPCAVYPRVPDIDCEVFRLPATGLSDAERKRALNQLHVYQSDRQSRTLGFQANQLLSYEDDLHPFLDFHINNVGDPFQSGSFTLNSKWMERAVLDYYAGLWHARWPHDPEDPDSYWGYVLTMGSTEGNLYGLWNARDYLEGKCLLDACQSAGDASLETGASTMDEPQPQILYQQAVATHEDPHAYSPVAFYSEDTHYSVVKAMRVLGIHTFFELGTNEYPGLCPITANGQWPTEAPSVGGGGGPGAIDVDALCELVEFFANKGYPILVCLNYGTTFKGAYDDVEQVGNRLMPILERHGLRERAIADQAGHEFQRTGFWIHVDGALAASYMPFVEMAFESARAEQRGPNFDFRLPYVHSMTMSGHKWIGAPWPCGVYMTKTKYLLRPPSRPNYTGSRDSTLAGSRNGFSAMVLWDYLARTSHEQQIEKALRLESLAEYAYRQLESLQTDVGDRWVARTRMSLTIRFRRPAASVVEKYSLANESLVVDGARREYSHIYVMSHVTKQLIDDLVADLGREDAYASDESARPASYVSSEPHAVAGFRPLLYVPDFGRGLH